MIYLESPEISEPWKWSYCVVLPMSTSRLGEGVGIVYFISTLVVISRDSPYARPEATSPTRSGKVAIGKPDVLDSLQPSFEMREHPKVQDGRVFSAEN